MPRRNVDLDYLNIWMVVLAGANLFIARVKLVLNVVLHFRFVLIL